MKTCLIVDDSKVIRKVARHILEMLDFSVDEAGDGQEALRMLTAPGADVDVVLMDVRMPRMDGLAATAQLTAGAGAGGPRVIVLPTFDLDEYVLAAIRAGASGFLLKDAQPEDLLGAIRTVHSGDAVIAPSATRRLLERVVQTPEPEQRDDSVLAALTDREREVLTLMGRGFSNQEIGAELFVAEATVKTHVGRVLAKLGARDRVQAVIISFETGLVAPGSH